MSENSKENILKSGSIDNEFTTGIDNLFTSSLEPLYSVNPNIQTEGLKPPIILDESKDIPHK